MTKSTKNQYTYFLFDWDNCIARTGENWRKAFIEVMRKADFELSDNEASLGLTKLIRENVHPLTPGEPTEKIWEEITEYVAEFNKTVKLNKHAKSTLTTLAEQGKKIALVSTSNRSAIDTGLEATNLGLFFDAIVSADDVTKLKPNPESLIQALKLLDADPSRSIKIGDKDTDILAAKAAGTDSVLYFPEEHNKWYSYEDYIKSNPDFIIKDHKEILTISSK